MTKRHLVIPDVQVKDGIDSSFLTCVGNYAADKRPDVIVQIGDFADMSSLSSYDKGKKSFEGRRYKKDIEASIIAMDNLIVPIEKEQRRLSKNKKRGWNPQLVLTLGNHENRINRAVEDSPELDGVISVNFVDNKTTGQVIKSRWGSVVFSDFFSYSTNFENMFITLSRVSSDPDKDIEDVGEDW